MVNQLAAAFGMGVYVMVVLYATKLPYTCLLYTSDAADE